MLKQPLQQFDHFVTKYWLAFGLFVFLTAFFWADTRSAYRTIVYLGLLAPALLSCLHVSRLAPHFRKEHVLILFALFLLYLCAVTTSLNPEEALSYTKHSLFIFIFVTAVGLLMNISEKSLQNLLAWTLPAAAIGGTLALYLDYSDGLIREGYRLTGYGSMANALYTGNLFGVFMVLALWFLLLGSRTQRSLAACSIIPIAAALIMTGSRSPLLAFTLAALTALLALNKISINRTTSAILLATPLFLLIFAGDRLLERGLSYRPELWLESFKFALEAPLFGHGLGAHIHLTTHNGLDLYDTHNMILAVLFFGGSLGVLLYFAVFFQAASICWQQRQSSLAQIALMLLVFGQVSLLFDGGGLIRRPSEIWLQLWLPLALALRVSVHKKSLPEKQHQSSNLQHPTDHCEQS